MKLILLALLATLSLASPSKQAASELNYIATEDYQCNLYLEYASIDLYLMAKAEEDSNPIAVTLNYEEFKVNSAIAIDYCKHINEQATTKLMEIISEIDAYYVRNYNEH